jgi:hypothetical protein
MLLSPGSSLGPYELLAPIGVGGMGEVYQARDTRLGRVVAIKISAEQYSSRFEREARAIAALNHSHICTLYDIGPNYMVMEFVQGETLANRLRNGPLPFDQVARYGAEIADALSAAHSQGIVHRDLKPANIMLTKAGVKVLDFGLAKIATGDDTLTAIGAVMGTPAYMAPEQREGKQGDPRTDIYALGLVLYEMATGKRPGSQPAATDGLPEHFDHVVTRCLEQDPDNRWQSARDVKAELHWTAKAPASRPAGVAPLRRVRSVGVAVGCAALLIFGAWTEVSRRRQPAASPPPLTRFTIDLSEGEQFPIDQALPVWLGIGPNGRVYYSVRRDGSIRMYRRGLGELQASVALTAEGAMLPFFSPDGQWIGFSSKGELMKAPISGGPAVTLCPASNPAGASWGPNGVVVFSPTWGSGLEKVSAQGGASEPLTSLNVSVGETSHQEPHFLPDGSGLLFTVTINGTNRIEALSLTTGKRSVLVQGRSPSYVGTGHIVFTRGETLFGVPFDARKLEITGPPTPVLEGIFQRGQNYALGSDGTLAYFPARNTLKTLVGVDRKGNARRITDDRRPFEHPRFSPDGKKVAVDGGGSIWVYDIHTGAPTRLTEKPPATRPIWTSDGKNITFAGWLDGKASLYSVPADGSSEPRQILPLAESGAGHFPLSWSPDGRTLAFSYGRPGTLRDVWMLPVGGTPRPFLDSPLDERPAMFSPDGRWIVYAIRQANRDEDIFVQPYPGPGGKVLISKGGGVEPVWSPSGREIFYRSMDGARMMAVLVQTQPIFSSQQPEPLFVANYHAHPGGFYPAYDVSRDGQQFVMLEPESKRSRDQLIVVVGWQHELSRLVSTK